jgi:hypothetical protein
MPDDEIWARLAGPQDSSVRLEFARGVAHHSVSLVRQALTLVPASAHVASESNDEEKTITAAPINFAREIQATHNKEAASVKAFSSKSPSANYLPAAEQFSDSGVQHVAVMSRNDMDLLNKPTSSQPLQTITPNKEVTHKEVPMVIKTKSLSNHSSISGAVHAAVDQNNVSCSQANDSSNRPDSAIPRIGVNCRISPSTANSHHFSERMTAPPPRAVHLVQGSCHVMLCTYLHATLQVSPTHLFCSLGSAVLCLCCISAPHYRLYATQTQQNPITRQREHHMPHL